MKLELFGQYEFLLLLGLVIMVVFLLIIVTFSWVHQKKKGKEENLQFAEKNEYQRKLHEIRIQQEEKERFRFARHLQNQVTALNQIAHEMETFSNAVADHELKQKLVKITEKCVQSSQQTEEISMQIAPAILIESGLLHALESLVFRFNSEGKADLFLVEKNYKKQDDGIEIMLFRIAQEIISNALKHGKPNRVDVLLTGTDHQITLEIWDNGLPFDLKQKLSENQIVLPGTGLKNIASRLQNNAELIYTHFEGTNRNKIVSYL